MGRRDDPRDGRGVSCRQLRRREPGDNATHAFRVERHGCLRAVAERISSRSCNGGADRGLVSETALETAAILITEHHIHYLPVVDGERPVGMVGMREVIRSAAGFRTGIGLGF